MVRGWKCARCDRVHTGNPTECRNCGHHVLEPMSGTELRERAEGTDAPQPLDLGDRPTYGGEPDEELHSGPDLNPDGSIKAGTETPDLDGGYPPPSEPSRKWRLLALLSVVALAAALTIGALVLTGGFP